MTMGPQAVSFPVFSYKSTLSINQRRVVSPGCAGSAPGAARCSQSTPARRAPSAGTRGRHRVVRIHVYLFSPTDGSKKPTLNLPDLFIHPTREGGGPSRAKTEGRPTLHRVCAPLPCRGCFCSLPSRQQPHRWCCVRRRRQQPWRTDDPSPRHSHGCAHSHRATSST